MFLQLYILWNVKRIENLKKVAFLYVKLFSIDGSLKTFETVLFAKLVFWTFLNSSALLLSLSV